MKDNREQVKSVKNENEWDVMFILGCVLQNRFSVEQCLNEINET